MKNNKDNMDEEIKRLTVDNSKDRIKKGISVKGIILLSVLVLISIPVFIFLYSWSISNEEFVDKSKSPNQSIANNLNKENKDNIADRDKEEEPIEKEKVDLEGKYPIEIYDWSSKPFNSKGFWSKDGIYDEIYDSIRKDASRFITAVSWMPASKGDGVNEYTPKTNDVNKKLLDDGFPNPDFSYTLSEDYYKAFIVGAERILNPTFGEWNSDKEINRFNDMMENSWWKSLDDKDEVLNWSKKVANNEDLPNLYDGVFWGEINKDRDLNVKEVGQDSLNQPILKVTIPVKFSAFDEYGEIISLEGNLKFTMLSNEDDSATNRVVLKDIDISIGNLIK